MKINIKLDSNITDIEVVIKSPELSNDVIAIKDLVEKLLQVPKKLFFIRMTLNILFLLVIFYFSKPMIIKFMLTLMIIFTK